MRTQPLLLRVVLGISVACGVASCASGSTGTTDGTGDQGSDQSTDTGDNSDGTTDGTGTTGNTKPDAGKSDAGTRMDASASDAGKSDAATSGGGKSDASTTPPATDGGGAKADGGTTPPPGDGGPVVYGHPDGYVNLAVAPSTAFDKSKPDVHPMANYTPPTGWSWYNIAGATCRDGKSPFGVMVHWSASSSNKLFIYFEGGGACANPGFCNLNPADVNHEFLGKGMAAIVSTSLQNTPQDPGTNGIFNFSEATNPYKDWNFVYIPYCTGDVHFGANTAGTIKGLDGQTFNFSGASNTKAAIARTIATFPNTTRFVAGGSSAGGYGAGLNYGLIQDTFANAEGSALLDASPPFGNDYSPVCLQKRWRESWNLDANIPSDCGDTCKSSDGGNLFNIVDYWRAKYPRAHIALISGVHDEIIRLFFALGNDNCSQYDTYDPVLGFIGSLGQTYDPAKFQAGLLALRTKYVSTGQLATFYMAGIPNDTIHQCLFDPRLYQETAGAGLGTIAAFLQKFTDDNMQQVGP